MALSETSYTITDTSVAAYAFTFDWVRVSHISASLTDTDGTVTVIPDSDIAISGTSGAATLTLSGDTLSNLALNETLRIYKTTPTTFDDRTVDFNSLGSVSLESLDDAFLHDISLIQDMSDRVDDTMQKSDSYSGNFDAEGLQVQNAATGTSASSLVTLAQLQAVETSSGALPSVDAAFDGYHLGVRGGSWTTRSPSEARLDLELGDAATRTVGASADGHLISKFLGDLRYALVSNDLSDLNDAPTARTNLGLGTAATLTAGTSANNAVQLDGSGNLPALPGVNLDMSGNAVYHKAGGIRDVINIVEITESSAVNVDNDGVAVSDDFETDSANNLELDAGPTYTWNNTSPTETAVNTSNDEITLTTGTWLLDLNVSFTNDHTATHTRYGIAIYNTSDSTVVEKLNNADTKLAGDANNEPTTSVRLMAIVTIGAAKTFAIRAATATSGDAYVQKGQMLCHRLA